MNNQIHLVLPYPPSGNHLWKHTANGKHYINQKAKDYYYDVAHLIRTQGKMIQIDQPMVVYCRLHAPDKRRRDLDNAWKVVSDALTKGNLWQDDNLIRKLTLEWCEPVKAGSVHVLISPLC